MLPETVAAADSIVLENVAQAEIKNLDLDRSGRHGLIRRHTKSQIALNEDWFTIRDASRPRHSCGVL